MGDQQLSLLSIEDSHADYLLIQRQCKHDGIAAHWHRVDSIDQLAEALKHRSWDLVLSDYHLPGMEFTASFALIHSVQPDLPVILISGHVGEETAVQLLKRGVRDFLLKDNLSRLGPAINNAMREAREVRARRDAVTKLERERFRLQTILSTASDGIHILDAEGLLVEANQSFLDMLGHDRSVIGRTHIFDIDAQDTPEAIKVRIGALIAERRKAVFETIHRRRDGTLIDVEINASGLEIEGKGFLYASSRDITERKKAADNLALQARRAEALLKLPGISDQLDEVAFMQSAQELAEDLTGSQISFIHLVNRDETTIELAAWSRRTLEHYCTAAFDKHYPVSQAGLWADSLRQKRPMVFNDYASSQDRRGLPEGHAELKRMITVPVIDNANVVMLAGVGNKLTDYVDIDVETVRLIANQIWLIVKKKRSETELRIAATAMETQEGTIICDAAGVILRVNQAFFKITGYSTEEAVGRRTNLLKSGRHDKAFYQSMWHRINHDGSWCGIQDDPTTHSDLIATT